MPTARFWLPAGSYTGDFPGTVPALTAGTIVQTSPVVGDTLTVTGSNAPTGSTFLWQIDSGGWTDAAGTNDAASYTTAGTGSFRRGVSTPGQAMVFTPAVTVAAGGVFSDSFTYADGLLSSANSLWVQRVATSSQTTVVDTNRVRGSVNNSAARSAMTYNQSVNGDQYAKITYVSGGFSSAGPAVAMQANGDCFYAAFASNGCHLRRISGGNGTDNFMAHDTSFTPTNGDILEIRVERATETVRVFHNGTQKISTVQSAFVGPGDPLDGGQVGFVVAHNNQFWDDWEGGNL
jgi:hypothetical protein